MTFNLEPKYKMPLKSDTNKPYVCTFTMKRELVELYKITRTRYGYTVDEFINYMVEHCLKELNQHRSQ